MPCSARGVLSKHYCSDTKPPASSVTLFNPLAPLPLSQATCGFCNPQSSSDAQGGLAAESAGAAAGGGKGRGAGGAQPPCTDAVDLCPYFSKGLQVSWASVFVGASAMCRACENKCFEDACIMSHGAQAIMEARP